MAKPNTRSTLKDYCLRNLGKPVIEINSLALNFSKQGVYKCQKFNHSI